MTPRQPRPARTRNATETRARILLAAEEAFAEKGYSQTGLRDIAARAGVVSSLLVKYFGTKAALFEAALVSSLDETALMRAKAGFGETLVESILDPAHKITTPAMIALSLGDAEARAISGKVAREHIIEPVARWLGAPDGQARAASMLMLSVGLAILSRHLRILDIPDEQVALRHWMVATVQGRVDGP